MTKIDKEWLQKEFLPEHKEFFIKEGRKLERKRILNLISRHLLFQPQGSFPYYNEKDIKRIRNKLRFVISEVSD